MVASQQSFSRQLWGVLSLELWFNILLIKIKIQQYGIYVIEWFRKPGRLKRLSYWAGNRWHAYAALLANARVKIGSDKLLLFVLFSVILPIPDGKLRPLTG
jgi:hypothetical protein